MKEFSVPSPSMDGGFASEIVLSRKLQYEEDKAAIIAAIKDRKSPILLADIPVNRLRAAQIIEECKMTFVREHLYCRGRFPKVIVSLHRHITRHIDGWSDEIPMSYKKESVRAAKKQNTDSTRDTGGSSQLHGEESKQDTL